MKRTVKNPGERKQEILDTAERLFIEYGYDETSVEMIIKEVGIAKGTFYHHFNSKDELLDLFVDQLIIDVTAKIKEITEGNGDAVEKLFDMSQYFRTLAIGKERITDYIHEERNAHIHLKIEKRVGPPMVDCYTRIVEQGIEEGLFRVNFPRDTALAMMGAAQGMAEGHHEHANREKVDPAKYMAALDIYGRLLGTDEGLLLEYARKREGGMQNE